MANLFKKLVENDLNNVIYNKDEFAETHKINGIPINCIVDNDSLKEYTDKAFDGISIGDILIFVSASELKNKKINLKKDLAINYDNKPCLITDIKYDMGNYQIILQYNI